METQKLEVYNDVLQVENAENKSIETNEQELVKTYTQEEYDKALSELKESLEKEAIKKEEFKKLSPEDRIKLENNNKEKEIAELKGEILKRDLRDKAIFNLSKNAYPVELADIVDYTSEDSYKKSYEKIIGVFKASLETAVNEKLKGKTPITGDNTNSVVDLINKSIRGGL